MISTKRNRAWVLVSIWVNAEQSDAEDKALTGRTVIMAADDITDKSEYQEHVGEKSYAQGDKAYEKGQKNSNQVKGKDMMGDAGTAAQAKRSGMQLVKNAGRVTRERRGYKDKESDEEKNEGKDGEKDEKDEKEAT
ncbi:hypothetical protein HER10_EVM0006861 [Colletotrichum scovillei]|uniref:uncharacterized protein n=1 Tax=Colletotrichum scovillei TaxID=1209932 RepID=UPI0015C3DF23|nr:uncharacterized protein HER10_EVM0006861 [Colletotrichum scovillei]KAF4781078.1 hypothetical protein HER10_EVM0006861 [Colletotrichum scovillei]